MSSKIEGHRIGCPARDEPMHQACVIADDGSILRRVDPSYDDLRAENERLQDFVRMVATYMEVRGPLSGEVKRLIVKRATDLGLWPT